jgi:hypothetical protein
VDSDSTCLVGVVNKQVINQSIHPLPPRPRLTLGIRLILTFFDSAHCLMVRRWRLIGHFPILYNPLPPLACPTPKRTCS